MGELFYLQGKYQKALPIIQRVLDRLRLFFKHDDPELAGAINNLAELFRAMGRLNEALSLYEEAEIIFRSALGNDHVDIVLLLTIQPLC